MMGMRYGVAPVASTAAVVPAERHGDGIGSMTMSDWRDRAGFCGVDLPDQSSGTLNVAQRATLGTVVERTKLAHDLVAALADRYDAFPARLVSAYAHQQAGLRVLLERYGEADLVSDLPVGHFHSAAVQAEYALLSSLGHTGRANALEVVRHLSHTIVDVVQPALIGLAAPDVRHTYLHVLLAANRHLSLSQAWCGR